MKKRTRKYVGFKRSERIGAEITRIISLTILEELSDPRVSGVSILSVEMSKDNHYAKVFFSMIGGEELIESAREGLGSAAGRFKRHIAETLRLQRTPELRFEYDPTMERAQYMDSLISEAAREASIPPAEDGDDGSPDGARNVDRP